MQSRSWGLVETYACCATCRVDQPPPTACRSALEQSAKKDKTKAIPACAAPPALVPTKTSEKTSIVE
jgi:hypothetical protein